MSKRKRGFKEAKYEKYLKEGRGQGLGSEYKPWIRIQDVASRGRSTRTKGLTTGRQHDFLSDMERNYFYILDFSEHVLDIREQYPLLMMEQTQSIADELNIKHPTDPTTNEPIVMTTDFLITVKREDSFVHFARTIKSLDDLESKRQIEKFEIERVYWEKQGIDWGIVTEKEIDKTFASNVEQFIKFYELRDKQGFENLEPFEISDLANEFLSRLTNFVDLKKFCSKFDELMEIDGGMGIAIFKHLVIRKVINIDMHLPFNVDKPLTIKISKDHSKSDVEAI